MKIALVGATDYVGMIDKLEMPQHRGKRFTIAY
jgi:hypothetical protein